MQYSYKCLEALLFDEDDMDQFEGYDPTRDVMPKHDQGYRHEVTWFDRVMRKVFLVMMCGLPVSLMVQVDDDRSLWLQVVVWIVGLAVSLAGFLGYAISGGRLPAQLSIYRRVTARYDVTTDSWAESVTEDYDGKLFETVEHLLANWRICLLAVAVALVLAGVVVWVYNVFVFN